MDTSSNAGGAPHSRVFGFALAGENHAMGKGVLLHRVEDPRVGQA